MWVARGEEGDALPTKRDSGDGRGYPERAPVPALLVRPLVAKTCAALHGHLLAERW